MSSIVSKLVECCEQNNDTNPGNGEEEAISDESEEGQNKRRRRGRRGGRNRGRKTENDALIEDLEGVKNGDNTDESKKQPEQNNALTKTPTITSKDNTDEELVESKPRRRKRKTTISAVRDTTRTSSSTVQTNYL